MRDETTIRSIEIAMSRIVRSMGRRDLARQVERSLGGRVDASFLQLIGGIDELTKPDQAPTIKDIARHLDVHHSRASRLVKDAIRAALVTRLASQEDARKSPLALTEKGREIADALQAARARYFALRLQGLSKGDRRNLARLLERFAENDAEPHPPGDRSEAEGEGARSARKLRARKRRKSGG